MIKINFNFKINSKSFFAILEKKTVYFLSYSNFTLHGTVVPHFVFITNLAKNG